MDGKQQAEAQIRAAAWQLVAQGGYNEALRALEQVAQEIKDKQWNDR